MKNRLQYLLLISLIVASLSVNGQTSNIMYHMWGIPQSSRLNPALNPEAGFHAGWGFGTQFYNTFLHTSDLLKYDENNAITLTPLSSLELQGDLVNQMQQKNPLGISTATPVQLGFRMGKIYLGLELGFNTTTNITMPGDFIELMVNGNLNQSEFDFSGLGYDFLAYSDVSMRVAYSISDELTVAWRGKLLYGAAHASTANTSIIFEANEDIVSINSNFEMNLAQSLLSIDNLENINDSLQSLEFKFSDKIKVSDALANKGLGMDLGAVYKLNDRFEFSASLVDFGYIKWSQGTYSFKQSSTLTFDGIKLDSLQDFDPQELMDSLTNDLSFTTNQDPYTTWLPTKLYVGAKFNVTQKFSLGAVSRTTYYNKKLREAFTLSANVHPLKRTPSLTVAYSYENRSIQNLGIGIMFRPSFFIPLPFYSYFMIDNIPLSYTYDDTLLEDADLGGIPLISNNTKVPIPQFRGITFMWGFNVRLGFNKEKKLKKDEPLFYF